MSFALWLLQTALNAGPNFIVPEHEAQRLLLLLPNALTTETQHYLCNLASFTNVGTAIVLLEPINTSFLNAVFLAQWGIVAPPLSTVPRNVIVKKLAEIGSPEPQCTDEELRLAYVLSAARYRPLWPSQAWPTTDKEYLDADTGLLVSVKFTSKYKYCDHTARLIANSVERYSCLLAWYSYQTTLKAYRDGRTAGQDKYFDLETKQWSSNYKEFHHDMYRVTATTKELVDDFCKTLSQPGILEQITVGGLYRLGLSLPSGAEEFAKGMVRQIIQPLEQKQLDGQVTLQDIFKLAK